MERAAEANRRLALTDPLTGLPNRRHLEFYLDRLADGDLDRFSLALFDVDGFKRFNDRHGYVAGDRVLAAIGTVLSRACANASVHPHSRNSGDLPDPGHRPAGHRGPTVRARLAARLGGDEFVVLFAGEKAARARRATDRMARAVARNPRLASHGITVSFGIAARGAGIQRWQDLLEAADRDLRRRRAVA